MTKKHVIRILSALKMESRVAACVPLATRVQFVLRILHVVPSKLLVRILDTK